MNKNDISRVIAGAITDIVLAVTRTGKPLSKNDFDVAEATLTAVIMNMTDDEALQSANILTTKIMMSQLLK